VLALLPLGGEGGRDIALVWSVHPARARQLQAMDAEDFARELASACGFALGRMQLGSERAVWPLQLGARVALAAPGGSDTDPLPLWSAGAPLQRDGTSFAAPQVAGVASLMMGVNPALKPADVTRLLKASAAPFPAGRCEPATALHTCGSGIVNAGAALRLAANR